MARNLTDANQSTRRTRDGNVYNGPDKNDTRPLAVYLLDLWSFVPYYMAHLCNALRNESVDAKLGSVRYHLDRNYFGKKGIEADSRLLDFGGGLRSPYLRRIVKAFEYVFNLFVLAFRLPTSGLDILHVQFLPFLARGFRFEIQFLKWIRSRGTRIVYTVHNLADRDSREASKPLYEELYKLADAVICHGREAREKLFHDFRIAEEKLWVIPHGPLFWERPVESKEDCRVMLGLPVDEVLVLCGGVISPYKGIPFLLDAWKRRSQSNGKSRLLIVGTGDTGLLEQIRTKVEVEGLTSSVSLWLRFIAVEELPLLYEAADILVYPYKACTTSGALLTGLNYGKAMITTKLPIFREILREDVEAEMVEYGDINGLARTLTELISSPDKRERLASGAAGRSGKADSWQKIAGETIECYRTALEQIERHVESNHPVSEHSNSIR